MNIDDYVRVTDENSVHHGQAGQLILPPVHDDNNRWYVFFFCGPYTSGHLPLESMTRITVDDMTEEECAVVMRETLR